MEKFQGKRELILERAENKRICHGPRGQKRKKSGFSGRLCLVKRYETDLRS